MIRKSQGTSIPFVTSEQVKELDRAMIEDYGVQLVQMMENAGYKLARLAKTRFIGPDIRGKSVIILAGAGGNGGGALAGARHLHNWGANVKAVIAKAPGEFSPAAALQLDILSRIGIPILDAPPPDGDMIDLIVDGLIGYSLDGILRDNISFLIRWANAQSAPILSLDIPSGVDANSGALQNDTIQAAATMALALPKAGVRHARCRKRCGELYLADIGVPPSLYEEFGLDAAEAAIFAHVDILRLS